MTDVDRELMRLISHLTDECQVLALNIHAVKPYGKECTARVIRDGFAGVVRAVDGDMEELFRLVEGKRFLPIEESLRVVELRRISWRYSIAQMPGAVAPEDEPQLILRYAADEPAAIAEVRSRHGVE